ncbi:MOS1T transposase, partial [Pseudoatta argentina]
MAHPILPNDPKAEEITRENELSFKLDEPVTMALNPLTNIDEEDSLSFVVLGRDSVEAQASLLASYTDLQQKSMSIDYKSLVSSMTVTAMQDRLVEVLQENVKLKETLRQTNVSMKQQFNTLTMWQEEVTKVHLSHKQQFAETKELINHLKKENAELKYKFSRLQHFENMRLKISRSVSEDWANLISNRKLKEPFFIFDTFKDISELVPEISNLTIKRCKQYITSIISEKLDEKLERLKEGLQQELPQLETEKELEFESAMIDDRIKQKLQQLETEKELELAMIDNRINCKLYSDVKTTESSKCSEAYSEKDQEIACLKESNALLEQKLLCVLTSVEQVSLETSNLSHQKFVQNIKQYNDMLQELTKCFVEQVERFAALEKSLKKIMDILRLDDDKMQCEEKLCQYYNELTDEQIKIITDRQTLIKSQNQFQKIFSDYNSVLYELQVMLDENAKLNILKDNSARENLETSEQLERDKQSLEQEKKIFDREKDNLENEQKSFESQKKSLDIERIFVQDERKLLEREKISLNEEKMSLDHQSQLYEDCERDLQNEKKILQARNEQLLSETNSLRQQIEKKNAQFKKIIEQFAQSTEEIQLLRSQLSLYEEDFQQEKKLKEALLEEKSKLDTELLKQIEFNKQLQESNNANVKLGHMFEERLADRRFHSYEEAQKWIDSWIASKDMSFFRRGIHVLPERWSKVVECDGKYFH